METKKKILSTALSLFNQYGYDKVSMRQIADALEVDRRNISYHFDKESLLVAIADQMWTALEDCRAQKRDFPSFENLEKEVLLYNELQNQYAFIFKDMYMMEHPIIHDQFKEFSETLIRDSQDAVAFAIQQGNMYPEKIAGSYNAICTAVWTIAISWLQLHSLQEIKKHEEVHKLIWSLIVPHFTEKGITAFTSYFGKDFYNSLGRPFDTKVKTVLF